MPPERAEAQIRAGASYLKILPGTRQQTLANSITAGLDEPYALFANPAATGFGREWQWSASYSEWIADIYNISIVHGRHIRFPSRLGNGLRAAIGFNYQGVRAFDATGGQQSSAVADDMLLTGSFGVPLNRLIHGLAVGANLKYFRSRLAHFDATSQIVDLGFLYRTRRYAIADNRFFDHMIFSLGASSSQLGRPLRFISEETPLPRAWRTGMAVNLGRHDGLQVQLTTSYTHALDEDGAFGFGLEVANALSPFTHELGRLVSVRGGYNLDTHTDNPLIRQFTLGLSFRLDDYMSRYGANVTPRNTAFRFDLAMQDGQSVSNVYQGSATFKTIRPEAFSIVRKVTATEEGDSLVVVWERSGDPDLYDHVNYLMFVARDDEERFETVLSVLESYEVRVEEIVDSPSFKNDDSVMVDLLYLSDTDNNRIASLNGIAREEWPLNPVWREKKVQADSPIIRYVLPQRFLEGDYFLTIVAYDRNGHVRTVEERVVPFHVDELPISPDLTIEVKPKLEREELEPVVLTLHNVRFEPDSFRLSGDTKAVLRYWASILCEEDPAVSFEIAGHTDSTGPLPVEFRRQYNQRLSENRARSVAQFLVASGVRSTQLVVKGYGESQPILSQEGVPLLAENRRVEVRVLADRRQPLLRPVAQIVFANNTATARNFSVTVYDSDELGRVIENLELSGKSYAIPEYGLTSHEQIYSERLKKWLIEMEPGEADSVRLPWDLSRPLMAAEIDAEDNVIESNETNNWDLEKLSATDLRLTLETQDLILQSTDTLRYSLHIQNLGPYTATNVDLTVELPSALRILGGAQIRPEHDLQVVSCHFDRINGASTVTFDLQAIVPDVSPDSTMYFTAYAWVDFSDDIDFSNNVDSTLACASLINFELDRFHLTSSAQKALSQIADFLHTKPFARYEVAGYADTTGQALYNLTLSQKRAASVARFLQEQGICSELLPSGFGENSRYRTHLRNRRVEIRRLF
jgi:outer membrane protein OmpA-like peptidoglycan-associated protein